MSFIIKPRKLRLLHLFFIFCYFEYRGGSIFHVSWLWLVLCIFILYSWNLIDIFLLCFFIRHD